MKVIKVIFRLFLVILTIVFGIIWGCFLMPFSILTLFHLLLGYLFTGSFPSESMLLIEYWHIAMEKYIDWLERIG